MIREAQFAEDMGFDFWGCSEQHFTGPVATTSAPEVLYGAVAHATSRIKLRTMSTVMLHFNHPLRVAERLATIDVLSRGRLELGTVRGNNPHVVKAFEIDAPNVLKEWEESLRLTAKALTQETVSHHGEYYTVEPVTVWPRLYQPIFPRTFVSSTGLGTHEQAGGLGLGVLSFTVYGWDHVEQAVKTYRDAVARATPIPGIPLNNSIGRLFLGGQLAATKDAALEKARPSCLGFMKFLINFFGSTGETSPDYAYLKDWEKLIAGHEDDLGWMNDNLPQVLNGTPDDVIEEVKRIERLGFDEAIFRIDGNGHRQIMESLELFGKYVIPEFHNPHDVVQVSTYEELGVPAPAFML
jgi:alkanesulfonate monooxygenase SsuD/methylene tetrahydromethanopterin reductase-like flavin-dependent oxidoreductase (luciferase family)